MSDEKLNRIENKIDDLSTRISSIDNTLAAQHVSLKDHIRRTELLENELKPIKEHVIMMKGSLKFIGLIALFAAIGEGFSQTINFIRGLLK